MYSIRPHSTNQVSLDLPTTMYSVRPIITPSVVSIDPAELKKIEHQQDQLLAKIDQLFKQLDLYEMGKTKKNEDFVVLLSVKKPTKSILDLIEQFRDQISINSYRHSSLGRTPSPSVRSSQQTSNKKVTIVWADCENLPSMVHSKTTLNDEQQIVNFLREQLSKKD